MRKRTRTVLITVSIALTLIALAIVLYFAQRIPMNPPGTVGNTAGNINNGGFFCEHEGTVYFSGVWDGGLYAMDPEEGNIRLLSGTKAQNLLAGGNYLYYFQTESSDGTRADFGQMLGSRSFTRCKLNGKNATSLTRDVVVTGQLVDNYLFLLTTSKSGISFYKMKIDQSERTQLADYIINPACAADGTIYFNGTDTDHYLYALDAEDDVVREFWRGNLLNPVLDGDYVYYMDVANDYRLCRYSISQDAIQVLTQDRVDCFNVGSGFIYYQKNSSSDPQLKCMRTDGSEVRSVAEGNYTNINMTSRYVYFRAFGDDSTMYHSPLGSDSYSTFAPPE